MWCRSAVSFSPGFLFTNCRIRSAPGDTSPRLRVRPVPVRRGFLSVAALRSSGSAGARAPLFAAFIATMPRVRLLRAVHHRLRLSAFPLRSRRTTRRDDAQPSQVPVSDVHACPELFDTEEPGHDSPIALQPVLPSTGGRVSALQTSWVFGAQSLRPTYPAANASRVTSRRPAHGSRCGVEWLAPSPRGTLTHPLYQFAWPFTTAPSS